jgi:phenylalanyl-tRNA synthetase beta chain
LFEIGTRFAPQG